MQRKSPSQMRKNEQRDGGSQGGGEGGQVDQLLSGGPGLAGFTSTSPLDSSVQGDPGQVAPNEGGTPWQAGGRCWPWSGVDAHCPSSLGGPEATLCSLPLPDSPESQASPHPRALRSCRRPPGCPREAADPVLPLSHHPWCWVPAGWPCTCLGLQLPPGRSQGVVASWLKESWYCSHPLL